jgi:hypothetical protein
MNYFKKLINIADNVSILIENITGKNVKRKLLEKKQDMESLESMEKTIGKSLK